MLHSVASRSSQVSLRWDKQSSEQLDTLRLERRGNDPFEMRRLVKMIHGPGDDGREQIHQVNPTSKLPNTWWNQQTKVVKVIYPWLTRIHDLEDLVKMLNGSDNEWIYPLFNPLSWKQRQWNDQLSQMTKKSTWSEGQCVYPSVTKIHDPWKSMTYLNPQLWGHSGQ